MTELKKIIIDDHEIEVDGAMTLIQACEIVGIEIPRFCYHDRLSIAGNCRMCLVEVVGGPPKPTASCAMQVKDLRPGPDGQPPVVRTNSKMVKKAREGVMEFLLINHPLDCPICDQGGECDLQDQAMAFGVDFSRFKEAKRAVDDLDLGPLVSTNMTRCISCTRCVRFTSEVAGISQMGQTGRGEDAEITSYLNETLDSNLQGNIIDLCPVGALTSKPYSFTARPWELSNTETIDVMDALGSNIRVDTKGREVMRILPLNHDGINEEWISDKTRFVWDGLRRQRLDKPYIRKDGKLVSVNWSEALKFTADEISGKKIMGLVGDLVSTESAYAFKKLLESMGGVVECRTDGAHLPENNRSGYVGNASIDDIDLADEIFLIGSNPRIEAPVLNARIRKAWSNGANVHLIGPRLDLTYEYSHLGSDRLALEKLSVRGLKVAKTKRAIIILGIGALKGSDGPAVLGHAMQLASASNCKFLVLHTAASRVGAMDIEATSPKGIVDLENHEVIFNLGSDEINIPNGPFVIYQGSHGDQGAHRANVILPAAAYTEESGIFVNTEGRPQLANRSGFAPGEARENWAILRALSQILDLTLEFDTLSQLREVLFSEYPHLNNIDMLVESEWTPEGRRDLDKGDFIYAIEDFYLTNPIARASILMSELSAQARARSSGRIAAE
ncbi:MAG: NADH-quinone oxidoreductase subunit G [Rhodobacteraceae bacterium]|nr:NADH-quinone oxidoreductase subunit G [Paracoccaceae bacterium]